MFQNREKAGVRTKLRVGKIFKVTGQMKLIIEQAFTYNLLAANFGRPPNFLLNNSVKFVDSLGEFKL